MDPWAILEFRTGLATGFAAAVVVVAMLWATTRPGRTRPLPVLGWSFVAAALAAIALDGPIVHPVRLVVALAGLSAVAAVTDRARWGVVASSAAALPFAWLLGFHTGLAGPTWSNVLVVVGAALGGTLVATTDRRWRDDAVAPGLFLLSVVGVYFTVPDTEEAAALLGVALPLAAFGWPLRRARLGTGGAAAATGLLCWVAAVGGIGRPPSIIGAVVCLGLLAGVSAAPAARRRATDRRLPAPTVIGVGVAHLGLVFVGSRVAGLRTDVAGATAIALLVVVASVVAGVAVDRRITVPEAPLFRRGRPASGRRA